MIDFEDIGEIVKDAADKSLRGDFKNKRVIELIQYTMTQNETIETAVIGSSSGIRYKDCMFVCTNRRILMIYNLLGWSIEEILFKEITNIEIIKEKEDAGFWRGLAGAVIGNCNLTTKNNRINISTLDKNGLGYLAEVVENKIQQNKTNFNASNNIHIENMSGNLAAYSSNFSQNYSSDDISKAITDIYEILKTDKNINDEERSEALDDVNTLSAELAKPNPNKKVVRFVLDNLDKIPQIAAAIEVIKNLLW